MRGTKIAALGQRENFQRGKSRSERSRERIVAPRSDPSWRFREAPRPNSDAWWDKTPQPTASRRQVGSDPARATSEFRRTGSDFARAASEFRPPTSDLARSASEFRRTVGQFVPAQYLEVPGRVGSGTSHVRIPTHGVGFRAYALRIPTSHVGSRSLSARIPTSHVGSRSRRLRIPTSRVGSRAPTPPRLPSPLHKKAGATRRPLPSRSFAPVLTAPRPSSSRFGTRRGGSSRALPRSSCRRSAWSCRSPWS